MTDLRVVFLGNHGWSVPTLDALAEAQDIDLVSIITNPPRPAGRGSRLRATPVADAAGRLGLAVQEVDGVRSGRGAQLLQEAAPDAVVVVAYGELLTAANLDIPVLGTLNLHFSLLPRWRGAAPVQRAILEGDPVTGVSVMLLDEGLDTGPVVAQAEEPVRDDDDAGTLGDRLAGIGAPLVLDALRSLRAGGANPVSQDHAAATVASRLLPPEREIDWNADAPAIVRRIRALAPVPGAVSSFRGEPLKILHAKTHGRSDGARSSAPPGSLSSDEDGSPSVSAGAGTTVTLLELVPFGKARMPAADWARGARPRPGERLGSSR